MNAVQASVGPTAKDTTLTQSAGPDGHWIELLHDGTHVLIRPIHKRDLELERHFIEALSPTSRRFRFLDTMSSPDEALLKRLTAIDPATDVAYVALIAVGAEKREIGVARFSARADGKDCEFAVTVSDEWQQRGLGTLLMQHLITAARARGIESMYSSDASDNDSMHKFAEHLKFQHQRDPEDDGQVLYRVDLQKARE